MEEKKEKPCFVDFWHRGIFSECPYGYDRDCKDCERWEEEER